MKNPVKLSLALCLALLSFSASALTINTINTTTGTGNLLTNALLAQNSGITVVGNARYRGVNNATLQQSGTYTGLSLAPANGGGPTLTMGDGIVLTTGSANVAHNNIYGNVSVTTFSGADPLLTDLYGDATNDANVLSFDFTVGAGVTSVTAQFMFGTEEYPNEYVSDIFGFFVDGENYAFFPDGSKISKGENNANFIDNPFDVGFGVEYDGLTRVYTVTGLLKGDRATHTISIGIADTFDTNLDSGVFVSSLQAVSVDQGGKVPEPTTASLLGLGLAGVAALRRRRAHRA